MLERAKQEITREEEKARKELREHVADLTAAATSKLLVWASFDRGGHFERRRHR